MVVPVPRSLDGFGPYPLQVGGQSARACAGEEEVAAQLHIEGSQCWIALGVLVVSDEAALDR